MTDDVVAGAGREVAVVIRGDIAVLVGCSA
jgi:hypothetical protein